MQNVERKNIAIRKKELDDLEKQFCSLNTKYPENLAAKSSLPLYYVEEAGSLNSQVDQTGADLKNEIRFNIEINLSVFSVNADDIISSEECLLFPTKGWNDSIEGLFYCAGKSTLRRTVGIIVQLVKLQVYH